MKIKGFLWEKFLIFIKLNILGLFLLFSLCFVFKNVNANDKVFFENKDSNKKSFLSGYGESIAITKDGRYMALLQETYTKYFDNGVEDSSWLIPKPCFFDNKIIAVIDLNSYKDDKYQKIAYLSVKSKINDLNKILNKYSVRKLDKTHVKYYLMFDNKNNLIINGDNNIYTIPFYEINKRFNSNKEDYISANSSDISFINNIFEPMMKGGPCTPYLFTSNLIQLEKPYDDYFMGIISLNNTVYENGDDDYGAELNGGGNFLLMLRREKGRFMGSYLLGKVNNYKIDSYKKIGKSYDIKSLFVENNKLKILTKKGIEVFNDKEFKLYKDNLKTRLHTRLIDTKFNNKITATSTANSSFKLKLNKSKLKGFILNNYDYKNNILLNSIKINDLLPYSVIDFYNVAPEEKGLYLSHFTDKNGKIIDTVNFIKNKKLINASAFYFKKDNGIIERKSGDTVIGCALYTSNDNGLEKIIYKTINNEVIKDVGADNKENKDYFNIKELNGVISVNGKHFKRNEGGLNNVYEQFELNNKPYFYIKNSKHLYRIYDQNLNLKFSTEEGSYMVFSSYKNFVTLEGNSSYVLNNKFKVVFKDDSSKDLNITCLDDKFLVTYKKSKYYYFKTFDMNGRLLAKYKTKDLGTIYPSSGNLAYILLRNNSGKYYILDLYYKPVFKDVPQNAFAKFDINSVNGSFFGDLMEVNINGKIGFINSKSKIIIPIIYDSATFYYSEYSMNEAKSNKFIILSKNGYSGVVDMNGRKVLDFKYKSLKYLGKYKGKIKNNIKSPYLFYSSFNNITSSNYPFYRKGNIGVINSKGQIVIPYFYDRISLDD